MSDPEEGKRELRFYLDDMIDFAQKVRSYTDGLSKRWSDALRYKQTPVPG